MPRQETLTEAQTALVRGVVRDFVTERGGQAAAAEAIGLSQQTVSRILAGGSVGVGAATMIARATGRIDIAALLVGSPAEQCLVDVPRKRTPENQRPREPLSVRVRRLRIAQGKHPSDRALAKAAGLPESTLSVLTQREKKNPAATVEADAAAKLARALGVTLEELLGETDPGSSTVSAPVRIVERDVRYPMRAKAIEVFELEKVASHAELEAAADLVGVALQSDDDPGFDWWRQSIREALAALKKIRQSGGKLPLGHNSERREEDG